MSAVARSSAAGRQPSPVPQPTTTNTNNEAHMNRKKIADKLFRTETPGKGAKNAAPTPRTNESSYRIPSMVFDDSTESAKNAFVTSESPRSSPTRKTSAHVPGPTSVASGSIDALATSEMPRSGTLSPVSENQWSSAVGHATSTGKSGRVIERLMAENDRLKREVELQVLRNQELERNAQTMKPQIEALRMENDNLNHANSMDANVLARRDRRIEQLKEEVALERSRREAAELLARKQEREKEELQDTARRDVQLAQEEAKHSTTHAAILEQSHKQLSRDYRQRAERWRKDVADLQAQRQADDEKFSRLDTVGDQMRSELEKARKSQLEFIQKFDEYHKANEEWKEGLDDAAKQETGKMRKLSEDMLTTANKMKWVMSLENSRAETEKPETEKPEMG